MTKAIAVHIVNAFVRDGAGGNPAGVVVDADDLSEADMQQTAAAVGVSETAFVSRSTAAGFKLDFFTPNMRIAHCGHATIAAFSYLVSIGRVGEGTTSKETVDGSRRITIRNGIPYMEQRAPDYDDPANWISRGTSEQDVVDSLGLNGGLLDERARPVVVNTGNRFLLVGVGTADILRSIIPDFAAIESVSEKLELIGYYIYTTEGIDAEHDASTRMFAPRYAIPEEAATGMAAGTLGCLLYDRLGMRKRHFVIEQGSSMRPPSRSRLAVELDLRDERISGLLVGGAGRLMRTVTVRI
jgi:PhzF family phenazine biosynthesis protein